MVASPAQTSSRDAYREAFLHHVHRLLQLGYERLDPGDFNNSEEDDISGEICKGMKHLTEDAPTEPWMRLFAVHDQDPINDIASDGDAKPRRGKRRPRLDVRLVSKKRTPNLRFCIEAKRLYRSDSIADYVKDDGLGAFLAGYYAASDEAAGMLGYVQSGTVPDWLSKLERKVVETASALRTGSGSCFSKAQFKNGPIHTYRTCHERHKTGLQLEVFHSFFIFC
jgi:hypothetical protein